jgi:hypothetical protein
MIKDAYDVIEKENAWKNIDNRIEILIASKGGHTGMSLAFVMRQINYIAQHGLDEFKKYVESQQSI